MFLCRSRVRKRFTSLIEEDGIKLMGIGAVLSYHEKKKRFKRRIRKCGVKKDKPSEV
jgi:hypothetical protein